MYEEDLANMNSSSTAKDHIRLLRTNRSRRTENPIWRLKVFSLREAPPFAALSYSWGEHIADTNLRLDTGTTRVDCLISADLSNALNRIRHTNTLEWLWVDALCIDQDSNEEKNHQVKMMRTIYEAADRVYVWLGEAIESHAPGQEFYHTSDMEEAALSAGINRAKVKEWVEQGQHVWWQRLWVIQEIVSCETIYVCVGNYSTSWALFWYVLNRYTKEDAQIICVVGIAYKAVIELNEQIQRVTDLRRQLRQAFDDLSIIDLLFKTSPTGVSDPRDRIYSLLGLASDEERLKIPISYGKSLALVFADVMKYVILETQTLDILFTGWPRGTTYQSCGTNASRSKVVLPETGIVTPSIEDAEQQLPSWIPNFMATPKTPSPWWLAMIDKSDEERARNVKLKVKFDKESLHVMALSLDVVSRVVPLNVFSEVDKDELCELVTSILDKYRYGKYGTADPRATLVPMNGVEEVVDLIHDLKEDEEEDYLSAAWHLFSTSFGFTCLSMEPLRKGDEIIMPLGSGVPIIVRKRTATAEELKVDLGPDVHTVIADCYVHGIMAGELIKLYKKEKIEPQLYHLK